jgi:hypothetical protein
MSRRSKTRIEKWFSFNRYRRRFGARALAADLLGDDLETLKRSIVSGDQAEYAYGSLPDVQAHLQRLRREFIGRPELIYHHAALIVLIRRESEVARNFARFKQLWLAEQAFLSEHLDLRWLVAACDTLIDHDPDAALRAALMNGVLLVNTVKLQETERFLQSQAGVADDLQAVAALQSGRIGLCDGLSAFVAGTDDTLRNMRWRLERVCAVHPLAHIVLVIFERLQLPVNDNVYSRFRQRHTRDRTRWW